MRILFSLTYSPILKIQSQERSEHRIVAIPRGSDWGLTGVKKNLHHVEEALLAMRRARGFDALVICNVGIEAFVIARLHNVFCPRTKIVLADVLMPREGRLVRIVRTWLKHADAFVCIRRGDFEALNRRFGVPLAKCHFVPFPVDAALASSPASDGDYIYSAGAAHRDWPTLVKALAAIPHRAVLSPSVRVHIPLEARDRIEVLPMQSPEDGRKKMAAAGVVVLSLDDTDLPSGPLVLLDAMALGKAIVASNVRGTRDYVRDGETALLVPPGNAEAMSAAIDGLMKDPARRDRLGKMAQEDVLARFTLENFLEQVVRICVELK